MRQFIVFPRKIHQREFLFIMDSSLKARGKAQKIKKRLVSVYMMHKKIVSTQREYFLLSKETLYLPTQF